MFSLHGREAYNRHMTIAELRGKISPTGTNLSERMEDLLTSDCLGCMRYLPAQKALVPLLRLARSFHGNVLAIPEKTIRVHYSFWPWIKLKNRRPAKQQYSVAWDRLGKAFPNLKLWYVDTVQDTVVEYQWSNPHD